MSTKPGAKRPPSPPSPDATPVILIVDDEPITRLQHELICRSLIAHGTAQTISAASLPEALRVLEETLVHVVLLDRNVGPDANDPTQNGISAIPDMRRIQPHLQILMLTGSNDTNDIVRAINLGALDYILKNTDESLVLAQIEKALSIAKLVLGKVGPALKSTSADELLAGNSPIMKKFKRELDRVAVTDSAVLLTGETGTGKSVSARAINMKRALTLGHAESPFVALNMAAIPEDLAESELFGSEKGAYTDATFKRGKMELAHNGTLFLDEIGEVSLKIQAKILTAIETKTFRRLGSEVDRKSNFKLVCATNRNLQEMVAKKQFREDLYMRISTFTIHSPSLAERKEDIPEIVRTMLPIVCQHTHIHVTFEELPKEFFTFLQEIHLPGNIRGIERCLSWLLVLSPQTFRGRPQFDDWRPLIESKLKVENSVTATEGADSTVTLDLLRSGRYNVLTRGFPGLTSLVDIVTKNIIEEALEKYHTRHEAAEAMGYSRVHFLTKIGQLGIGRKRLQKKKIKQRGQGSR
ncbi:MAG: sigma-54-dependent Fis family transcriptional regulator [Bdellovibrionales bacterium]|nr:sigma-54-dependent Fis family transcriptional regulator [Bdellovibrionales bacterium]